MINIEKVKKLEETLEKLKEFTELFNKLKEYVPYLIEADKLGLLSPELKKIVELLSHKAVLSRLWVNILFFSKPAIEENFYTPHGG